MPARTTGMANLANKHDGFDAATSVMDDELLQSLTRESSDPPADLAVDVVIEVAQRSPTNAAPAALLPDETMETELPHPGDAIAHLEQPIVRHDITTFTAAPSRRGSRVFLVCGIVAAVVLAFDASLFVLHGRAARRQPAPTENQPLPKYMLLPIEASASSATPDLVTPDHAPATAVAEAVATTVSAPPERPKHRHHRHSNH